MIHFTQLSDKNKFIFSRFFSFKYDSPLRQFMNKFVHKGNGGQKQFSVDKFPYLIRNYTYFLENVSLYDEYQAVYKREKDEINKITKLMQNIQERAGSKLSKSQ